MTPTRAELAGQMAARAAELKQERKATLTARLVQWGERFAAEHRSAKLCDDPKPGERCLPSGFMYPALIRAALVRELRQLINEGVAPWVEVPVSVALAKEHLTIRREERLPGFSPPPPVVHLEVRALVEALFAHWPPWMSVL